MLTSDLLHKIAPYCKAPAQWAAPLNAAMEEWEINNRERVCAFLGQILHESSSLNILEENLHYSGTRLMQVWPHRFPNYEATKEYAWSPIKLANLIYGDRMGNRGVDTGDGWKYHGRGPIMLTGMDNYVLMQNMLKVPLITNPEMALAPWTGARIAAAFWHFRDLNTIADAGTEDGYRTITIKINGGLIGWSGRKAMWESAKKEITTWPVDAPGPKAI